MTYLSASIKIIAVIAVPAGTSAAAVSAGVSSTLGTVAQVSSKFGVMAVSAPTIVATTQADATAEILTASAASLVSAAGLAIGVLVGIIAGACVALIVLIVLIVYCCCFRRKNYAKTAVDA